MDSKVYIYALVTLVTAFSLSGINFNGLFKTNHKIEAYLFILLVLISISYLVSEFIINLI